MRPSLEIAYFKGQAKAVCGCSGRIWHFRPDHVEESDEEVWLLLQVSRGPKAPAPPDQSTSHRWGGGGKWINKVGSGPVNRSRACSGLVVGWGMSKARSGKSCELVTCAACRAHKLSGV